MDSVIIKELQNEIREKKRIASGVHYKKGVRGYVGKMLFPTDFMGRKEKYTYRKSSKVEVSNMYDTIKSMAELKELPEDEQKKHLEEYRSRFTGKQIAEGMGIAEGTYYGYVRKLGLTREYNLNTDKKQSRKTSRNKDKKIKDSPAQNSDTVEIINRVEPNYKPEGIIFGYGGERKAPDIIKKLEKLSLLLEDEESTFEVEIKIKELA